MMPEGWMVKGAGFERIVDQYREDMREVENDEEYFDYFAFGQWVAEQIENYGWGL